MKGIGGHPHDEVQCWENMKYSLSYMSKKYISGVFVFAWKAKRILFASFLSSSQQLFKNIRELGPKKNLQTIEQLIKLFYSLL